MRRHSSWATLIAFVLLLAGCKAEIRAGNEPDSEVTGVYKGLIDSGREVSFWTTENGDFYILMGQLETGQFRLTGVIIGKESWQDERIYTDRAARFLFDRSGRDSITIDANLKQGQSVIGLLGKTAEGYEGFTARYDTVSEQRTSLPDAKQRFQGFYTGHSTIRKETEETIITFDSSGRFTGESLGSSGCRFNGRLDRNDNPPFLSSSMHFVDSNCVFFSKLLKGSAIFNKAEGSLAFVLPAEGQNGGAFFHGFLKQ